MSTTFIKIPNSIVGNLKKHRCTIYLYLLYLCTVQQSDSVKVRQETIAQKLGISFKESVNVTLRYLQTNGYITMEHNISSVTGRQTCNTITVCSFDPQSDYFLLPSEFIFVEMPSVATELLLTLYMFAFNDPFCFPSFTQISKTAKIGASSIVKAYTVLEEKGIIKKENYMKKDGSKGHNRYFLIKKIERIVGSEKTNKLLNWIRKQKTIFFELWQIIKEVLMGNTSILNEICVQFDCCETSEEYQDFEYKPESDNVSLDCECQPEEADTLTSVAPVFGEFLKQKISRIRSRFRHFFASVSQKFKMVLP